MNKIGKIDNCKSYLKNALYKLTHGLDINKITEIHEGVWIDVPYKLGFNSYPGIYICISGSNVCYGSYTGGFETEDDAIIYANALNLKNYRIVNTRQGVV